jgi:hypothetical protein
VGVRVAVGDTVGVALCEGMELSREVGVCDVIDVSVDGILVAVGLHEERAKTITENARPNESGGHSD